MTDPHGEMDYRARVYASYRTGQGQQVASDDRESRARYLRHLIRLHFPEDRASRILDLGCGSGTLVHFLHEAGYANATGVDTSPEQVQTAAALGIQGIEQGDLAESLRETASGSIDVVVAFDVIEHMTKQELLEFGDAVHRVLKPGGRWIIHCPNCEGPFGSAVRYRDWTHEQAFSPQSIRQMAHAVGFREVRCFEEQPVRGGWKGNARWLVWQLIRGILRVYRAAETGAVGGDCIFTQNLLAVAIR